MFGGISIVLFLLTAQQPASDQAARSPAPVEEAAPARAPSEAIAASSMPANASAPAPKPEPEAAHPSTKSALLLTSLGGGLLGGGLTACLTAGICAGATYWLWNELTSSMPAAKDFKVDETTIKYFWPSGALAVAGVIETGAGLALLLIGVNQAQ